MYLLAAGRNESIILSNRLEISHNLPCPNIPQNLFALHIHEISQGDFIPKLDCPGPINTIPLHYIRNQSIIHDLFLISFDIFSLIPAKNIPGIDLILHILQTAVIPVSQNNPAHILKLL